MPDNENPIMAEGKITGGIGSEKPTEQLRGATLESNIMASSYGLMDHFRNYATHMNVTSNAHLRTYTNALHDAIYAKCGSSYTGDLAKSMPTVGYTSNNYFADIASGGKNHHVTIKLNNAQNYASNQLYKLSDVSYNVSIENVAFTSLYFVNTTATSYRISYYNYNKTKSITAFCQPFTYRPTTASHLNISYWLTTTYAEAQSSLPQETIKLFKSNYCACYFNVNSSSMPTHDWSVTQHIANYSNSITRTVNVNFVHTPATSYVLKVDHMPTYIEVGQRQYAYFTAYSNSSIPLMRQLKVDFNEAQYPHNTDITYNTDESLTIIKKYNNGPPWVMFAIPVDTWTESLSYAESLSTDPSINDTGEGWSNSGSGVDLVGSSLTFSYFNFNSDTVSNMKTIKRYFVRRPQSFEMVNHHDIDIWMPSLEDSDRFFHAFGTVPSLIKYDSFPVWKITHNGWDTRAWFRQFRIDTTYNKLNAGRVCKYSELNSHNVPKFLYENTQGFLVTMNPVDFGFDLLRPVEKFDDTYEVNPYSNYDIGGIPVYVVLNKTQRFTLTLNNKIMYQSDYYYSLSTYGFDKLEFEPTEPLICNSIQNRHLGFIKLTFDYVKPGTGGRIYTDQVCYVHLYYRTYPGGTAGHNHNTNAYVIALSYDYNFDDFSAITNDVDMNIEFVKSYGTTSDDELMILDDCKLRFDIGSDYFEGFDNMNMELIVGGNEDTGTFDSQCFIYTSNGRNYYNNFIGSYIEKIGDEFSLHIIMHQELTGHTQL